MPVAIITNEDEAISEITKHIRAMQNDTLKSLLEFAAEIATYHQLRKTGKISLCITFSQGGINASNITSDRKVK